MYGGTYTVSATKDQWSTDEVTGVLVSEGALTPGVDMMLVPLATYEACDSPGVAIPDNDPLGVSTQLLVDTDLTIADVEVYVEIAHTFVGDLIVELTSPRGTTVRLHNESGGSADNIVGWYPLDLTPYETLDAYAGEPAYGNWTLFASDNAGYDTGTITSWCVKVIAEQGDTGIDDVEFDAPLRHVLRGASPNPFNPVTEIAYGLSHETEVSVKVYDVTGRLVRVLRDGVEPAGYHSVTWDGRDDRGESVASGVDEGRAPEVVRGGIRRDGGRPPSRPTRSPGPFGGPGFFVRSPRDRRAVVPGFSSGRSSLFTEKPGP